MKHLEFSNSYILYCQTNSNTDDYASGFEIERTWKGQGC